ncbi:MAG TPA: hypothetical protein VHS29_13770, partial [Candidatus Acidoferrales bacterium]|nr:hypothetical protein [Candidatus Acidoferrales bacterium]
LTYARTLPDGRAFRMSGDAALEVAQFIAIRQFTGISLLGIDARRLLRMSHSQLAAAILRLILRWLLAEQ